MWFVYLSLSTVDAYTLKVNNVPYPKKTFNAHWNKSTQNLVILMFCFCSDHGLFAVNTVTLHGCTMSVQLM